MLHPVWIDLVAFLVALCFGMVNLLELMPVPERSTDPRFEKARENHLAEIRGSGGIKRYRRIRFRNLAFSTVSLLASGFAIVVKLDLFGLAARFLN